MTPDTAGVSIAEHGAKGGGTKHRDGSSKKEWFSDSNVKIGKGRGTGDKLTRGPHTA